MRFRCASVCFIRFFFVSRFCELVFLATISFSFYFGRFFLHLFSFRDRRVIVSYQCIPLLMHFTHKLFFTFSTFLFFLVPRHICPTTVLSSAQFTPFCVFPLSRIPLLRFNIYTDFFKPFHNHARLHPFNFIYIFQQFFFAFITNLLLRPLQVPHQPSSLIVTLGHLSVLEMKRSILASFFP